ncbi:MAG: hypothetical protein HY594_01155, partial [Candidatus Omnitrophica bacterium]|nr:hypothetical protein [Candidatus Omnitrophota bacterium]
MVSPTSNGWTAGFLAQSKAVLKRGNQPFLTSLQASSRACFLIFFPRSFFSLFLILALSLPSPAFAMRNTSAGQSGLEEELTGALGQADYLPSVNIPSGFKEALPQVGVGAGLEEEELIKEIRAILDRGETPVSVHRDFGQGSITALSQRPDPKTYRTHWILTVNFSDRSRELDITWMAHVAKNQNKQLSEIFRLAREGEDVRSSFEPKVISFEKLVPLSEQANWSKHLTADQYVLLAETISRYSEQIKKVLTPSHAREVRHSMAEFLYSAIKDQGGEVFQDYKKLFDALLGQIVSLKPTDESRYFLEDDSRYEDMYVAAPGQRMFIIVCLEMGMRWHLDVTRFQRLPPALRALYAILESDNEFDVDKKEEMRYVDFSDFLQYLISVPQLDDRMEEIRSLLSALNFEDMCSFLKVFGEPIVAHNLELLSSAPAVKLAIDRLVQIAAWERLSDDELASILSKEVFPRFDEDFSEDAPDAVIIPILEFFRRILPRLSDLSISEMVSQLVSTGDQFAWKFEDKCAELLDALLLSIANRPESLDFFEDDDLGDLFRWNRGWFIEQLIDSSPESSRKIHVQESLDLYRSLEKLLAGSGSDLTVSELI